MCLIVSLHDAKRKLSTLVDRAAGGEEIVITKNGVPHAKIVPLPILDGERVPAGALGLTGISDDFEARDPNLEVLFAGD